MTGSEAVCDVHEQLPGGDHSIFIGAVRHCRHTPGRNPLVYFASQFGAVKRPDDAFGHVSEMLSMSGI